jgi:hypothetical protein
MSPVQGLLWSINMASFLKYKMGLYRLMLPEKKIAAQ